MNVVSKAVVVAVAGARPAAAAAGARPAAAAAGARPAAAAKPVAAKPRKVNPMSRRLQGAGVPLEGDGTTQQPNGGGEGAPLDTQQPNGGGEGAPLDTQQPNGGGEGAPLDTQQPNGGGEGAPLETTTPFPTNGTTTSSTNNRAGADLANGVDDTQNSTNPGSANQDANQLSSRIVDSAGGAFGYIIGLVAGVATHRFEPMPRGRRCAAGVAGVAAAAAAGAAVAAAGAAAVGTNVGTGAALGAGIGSIGGTVGGCSAAMIVNVNNNQVHPTDDGEEIKDIFRKIETDCESIKQNCLIIGETIKSIEKFKSDGVIKKIDSLIKNRNFFVNINTKLLHGKLMDRVSEKGLQDTSSSLQSNLSNEEEIFKSINNYKAEIDNLISDAEEAKTSAERAKTSAEKAKGLAEQAKESADTANRKKEVVKEKLESVKKQLESVEKQLESVEKQLKSANETKAALTKSIDNYNVNLLPNIVSLIDALYLEGLLDDYGGNLTALRKNIEELEVAARAPGAAPAPAAPAAAAAGAAPAPAPAPAPPAAVVVPAPAAAAAGGPSANLIGRARIGRGLLANLIGRAS